jgi:hypothetical protein
VTLQPAIAPLREPAVVCVSDVHGDALLALLARYGLRAVLVGSGDPIPGSYWGDREAGLIRDVIYFRADTPLHSVLHEACHYICMDATRRTRLERDAGGDHDEENAVCRLQILLADHVPGAGQARMCADMDAWGYTFRLGSARAWFEQDAEDAREWLAAHGLITASGAVIYRLRGAESERPTTKKA